MAGDWIKMRTNLHENPKVLMIADMVGLDVFGVVGRLHRLWSWVDQHSENGHAVVTLASRIDILVEAPKFADALRAVDWLSGDDGSLSFPDFNKHNGQTAKRRAQAAQRQANRRKTPSRSSHANSVTKCAPREEKRREDISPLSPPTGGQKKRARRSDFDERYERLGAPQ